MSVFDIFSFILLKTACILNARANTVPWQKLPFPSLFSSFSPALPNPWSRLPASPWPAPSRFDEWRDKVPSSCDIWSAGVEMGWSHARSNWEKEAVLRSCQRTTDRDKPEKVYATLRNFNKKSVCLTFLPFLPQSPTLQSTSPTWFELCYIQFMQF